MHISQGIIMKSLLVVTFVCGITVYVAGELCGLSPHGCSHTHCSGDNVQPECLNHECTCITTHSCTQHSDCSAISGCPVVNAQSPICSNGRCHCTAIVGR